jgi:hypothetical protein
MSLKTPIDTLQHVMETFTFVKSKQLDDNTNYWILIASIEFLVILLLLLNKKKKTDFSDLNKSDFKKMKSQDIDMENLMNSITNSKELYKELSKKCHPDRFVNTELQFIAEKIFQEISENKRDYNSLLKLKERAIKELNINF